ncbi:MAG: hypothetical protein NC243_11240 [Lachnoclostridium sp.]|nr:hypothetical protein [Lachnoclostridium sp.]MCM1385102.1 hypothetical protein [Lachnoclostridium sp.]
MLTDLYVIDKHSGKIHKIGDNPHDSFYVDSQGVLHYYNLQNGDGCSGDGYENGKGSRYTFLPQDKTRPMMYENFDQPEMCLRDTKGKCNYPITECENCPKRQIHIVK